MKKLVYILPEASQTSHMKYNVEFISALQNEEDVEIFLIIERGNIYNLKQKTRVKYVRFTGTNFFTRIPKILFFLLESFLFGFRKVYVHYSFVGAISASLFPFVKVFYWNCGMPWNYKRPILQDFYESFTYKLVDNFVTASENLAKKYSEFYNFDSQKSIIIPNWIDVEKVSTNKLNTKEKQKILFFNQRISERKGANYLPKILEANPNVKLLISNEGPYKEKLLQELKEKKLLKNVEMLGKISQEKVLEIFQSVDLYILPSNEEGMSHSLMEAFASGTPTVAFNVGATKEMFPENFKDFVVEAGNISEFNKKIQELLNDEEKSKKISNALREEIKKYDKKIVLKEFVKKIF